MSVYAGENIIMGCNNWILRFICINIIALLGLRGSAYSQAKHSSIDGRVIDENDKAVEDATVALFRFGDSVLVKAVTTSSTGGFLIDNIKSGKYYLQITKMGCQPLNTASYNMEPPSKIKGGVFLIRKSTTDLNTIVVTNKRTYIEVRADRTILNVDKSILATGASVYDLLGNAPGIKTGIGGGLSLKANQNALILIDGRPINAAGQDLDAVLHGLQSSNVERIELIPNPPANYDANGAGGVINIILKKNRNDGLNGYIQATAGIGKYAKNSESLNLNYRHKSINVYGTLGHSNNKAFEHVDINRNVNSSAIHTNSDNVQKADYLTYNSGIDYNIDSSHTVGVNVRGSYIPYTYSQKVGSEISYLGRLDSVLNTSINASLHYSNSNYNINYYGVLGHTKQSLTVNADYTSIHRQSFKYINSTLSQYNTGFVQKDTLRSISPLDVKIKSVNADYYNPVTNNVQLRAGLKYSAMSSEYQQSFDQQLNQIYIPDNLLTNVFHYKEQISSAYANVQHQGAVYSYYAGIRMEHTYANVLQPAFEYNRHYTNFFPSVQFDYNFIGGHQFEVNYNYRINRPNYNNLNPIYDYLDQYYYQAGYVYLKPAYGNYLQISDTYHNKYIVTFYAEQVKNFFGFTYFMQNAATKVNVVTRRNIKHESAYGLKINLPVDINYWWNINLSADASYQRFEDDTINLNRGTKDFIFDLYQKFTLNKMFSAELNAHYESATFYGTERFLPVYYVNSGITGQITKAASLTLTLTDVFNTRRDRYATNYQGTNLTGTNKQESQIAKLTFIYRFGRGNIKSSRTHTTGNAEELRRAPSN